MDAVERQRRREGVGRLIRELRDSQGLSERRFVGMAGISRDYLRRVESGLSSPTLDKLNDISDALGVELWELVKEERVRNQD